MDLPETAFPEGWGARPPVASAVTSASSDAGVMAGWFGVAFGLLSIFSIGFIFVPIAAICSFVGLSQGLYARSREGAGVSFVGGMLTVSGAIVTPTLWGAVVSGIVAAKISLSSLAVGISPPPLAAPFINQAPRILTTGDSLQQQTAVRNEEVFPTSTYNNVNKLKKCSTAFLRLWDTDRQSAFTKLPRQPCIMPHETGGYICDKDGCARIHVWQDKAL